MPSRQRMQLNHRFAQITDLESVYDLYMDSSANPYLTFDQMSVSEFLIIYQAMISDQTLFVVEFENTVIATYRLITKSHRQAHIIYLGGFTVKSSLKGKGFGFQILEHIKNEVKKQSVKRIELTVDVENTPAINLYRKVGFEIEGRLKNNYRLASTGKYYDEYVMALLIE